MPKPPTFLIAGAMRCGTTSLNAYLREHPDVAVSRPKEVHFFDNNFDKGLDWYLQHFPGSDEATAVGEATPDYLYEPETAERIAGTLPEAKILLLLRDPVDRAQSHYWHNRSVGREELSFEDALDAEEGRIARGRTSRARFSYVDRGRYTGQIEHMMGHFPREQILVQTFDELTESPTEVYQRACRFIGVADDYIPENLGDVTNAYVEYRSAKVRDAAKALPRRLRNAVAVLNRRDSGRYEKVSRDAVRFIQERTLHENAALGELAGLDAPWIQPEGPGS